MAKDKKRQLLAELKRQKHSCTLKQAEEALRVWGFTEGRTKGNVRVWNYKHVTLTLHSPHGRAGKNLDPGAVAMVIRKIEEAEVVQLKEEEAQDAE
jgi:hypothetical protein